MNEIEIHGFGDGGRIGRSPRAMIKRKIHSKAAGSEVPVSLFDGLPLRQLDVVEVTGHNLEARGREEVNRLLSAGWKLLHIYTLKYEEDGVWRERPMAILGKLRNVRMAPTERIQQRTSAGASFPK